MTDETKTQTSPEKVDVSEIMTRIETLSSDVSDLINKVKALEEDPRIKQTIEAVKQLAGEFERLKDMVDAFSHSSEGEAIKALVKELSGKVETMGRQLRHWL